MHIRPFDPKDGPAIRDLILTILDQEFSVEKKAYPPTDLDAIEHHYRGPRDIFLVAEEDRRIVGTLAVKEDDTGTALLRRLFVDAAYRGKRIGSQLVDRAIAFCRERGYKRISFRATTGMTKALALMRRKGFEEKEKLAFGEIEMIHFNLPLSSEPR